MRIFDMLKAGQDEYILSESINLIGMCYTSLGQKPDKEQMKGMANLLSPIGSIGSQAVVF